MSCMINENTGQNRDQIIEFITIGVYDVTLIFSFVCVAMSNNIIVWFLDNATWDSPCILG